MNCVEKTRPRINLGRRAGHLLLAALLTILLPVLSAQPVGAETGQLNLHWELGPSHFMWGWQAKELGTGPAGTLAVEWTPAARLGLQLSTSYMAFFKGAHPPQYRPIGRTSASAIKIGMVLRLFNDQEGYLKSWHHNPRHTGNLKGYGFIDVNGGLTHTGNLNRFSWDLGGGVLFSVINGLQLGPVLRFFWIVQPNSFDQRDSQDGIGAVLGLRFTLARPSGIREIPDTDADRLLDPDDQCPTEPEDKDGFEDEDGCPDEDNDQDGIPDETDQCPLTPEDRDGFEDTDGCPDEDNDQDGIPDPKDACPMKPEDKDGFEDEDGCPDLDNDADKILDVNDQCPLEKEVINGVDDSDGCPDEAEVKVEGRQILGGEKIYFEFGSARIKRASDNYLKQLTRLIEMHPEYAKISIEGHADRVGPGWFNQRLSVTRATRVKEHLIKMGVDGDRLTVVGYGETKPKVVGTGYRIRAQNRRVEFYIVEFAAPPTPTTPQNVPREEVHE